MARPRLHFNRGRSGLGPPITKTKLNYDLARNWWFGQHERRTEVRVGEKKDGKSGDDQGCGGPRDVLATGWHAQRHRILHYATPAPLRYSS